MTQPHAQGEQRSGLIDELWWSEPSDDAWLVCGRCEIDGEEAMLVRRLSFEEAHWSIDPTGYCQRRLAAWARDLADFAAQHADAPPSRLAPGEGRDDDGIPHYPSGRPTWGRPDRLAGHEHRAARWFMG